MRVASKVALGVTALAMPVGYLVTKHVSWETTPQSKKRMLAHHLTFWSMLAMGLVLVHRALFNQRLSGLARAWRVLFAGALAAPAFKAGEVLSNILYPHQQQQLPLKTAQPVLPVFWSPPANRYVPPSVPITRGMIA
jgi:hypothetical protein